MLVDVHEGADWMDFPEVLPVCESSMDLEIRASDDETEDIDGIIGLLLFVTAGLHAVAYDGEHVLNVFVEPRVASRKHVCTCMLHFE